MINVINIFSLVKQYINEINDLQAASSSVTGVIVSSGSKASTSANNSKTANLFAKLDIGDITVEDNCFNSSDEDIIIRNSPTQEDDNLSISDEDSDYNHDDQTSTVDYENKKNEEGKVLNNNHENILRNVETVKGNIY